MSNLSPENKSPGPSDSDVKVMCIQTLAMLEPLLTNKQFALASIKMQRVQQKISPEDYEERKKVLDREIYALQKRIVREVDVLGKLQ